MEDEIRAINQKEVWTLVHLPPGSKIITTRSVYQAKTNAVGNIQGYKERLVATRYYHKPGINFQEIDAR